MSDARTHSDELSEQVEMMMAAGIAPADVAAILGIDVAMLKSQYARELRYGKAKMIAAVGAALFEQATGRPAIYDDEGRLLQAELKPDKSCAMFIMRTQGGWKENHAVQIADPTAGARERLAAAIDAILANSPDRQMSAEPAGQTGHS